VRALAVAVGIAMLSVAMFTQSASASSPIALYLPQETAFTYLGHSCGGIQEQSYATGFDATTGYPAGLAYVSTTCGGSGRGGGYHHTTYTAWVSILWDFTGAVVTSSASSGGQTDPNLVAYDSHGNEVYNANNHALLVLADGYIPLARVTGISVSFGPAAGGTSVTLTGTGFTNTTGVNFGSSPAASYTVNSDTSIIASAPAKTAGPVNITVVDAGGASLTGPFDQFTFIARPIVTGVSPGKGPVAGDTKVIITGSNFNGAYAVSFGEDPAGFTVVKATKIVAYSPATDGPDQVRIKVASAGGTSASRKASRFTYVGKGTGGGN
jgi:hypothetical protein